MHDASVAFFLVAVAVLGMAPLLMLGVYAARRRHDRRPTGNGPRGTPVRALVIGAVAVVAATVGTAWFLGSHPTGSLLASDGGMNGGMSGMVMEGSTDPGGSGASDTETNGEMALPSSLSGMSRVEILTGPRAMKQVDQLHKGDFAMVSAGIAMYRGPAGEAMVWVARGTDEADAVDLTRRMVDSISSGGSPFAPPRRVAGMAGVWTTNGMGQVHFFFSRGDEVWWLSADPGNARDALDQLLEFAG